MRQLNVSLDDKYAQEDGQVFLTGIQALVRLLLDQHRSDRAAGMNTAGFVSGYRGSPLGGFDQQMWRAQKFLDDHQIVFRPGVNEELGATSVWGSQQVNLFPKARHDGVFGLWYGKAPGLDRATDAMRHANFAGTHPNGGVLAIAGDDHVAKSSTLPAQSELAFMDVEMPVFSPATIQDVVDYGLYGYALSRFSGLWVGLIALADGMDSGATVDVNADRFSIVQPQDFQLPPGGLGIRGGDDPLSKEERLRHWKLPAARAFLRANTLNHVVVDSPQPRIGILATGKAYIDLRESMTQIGLTEEKAAALGLRIMKIAVPWPLQPDDIRDFADGLESIIVFEHKRPLMEPQLKDFLYALPDAKRPKVFGKTDLEGKPFLSDIQELSAPQIVEGLARVLPEGSCSPGLEAYRARAREQQRLADQLVAKTLRTPFYCSGCPHNTSTRVPEGSRALAGIGCHYMAMFMDRSTDMFTQMGGEGTPWIGQEPFTDEEHVFANLGDGTYFHSGILAIRAAVSANARMTYKLLFNDAVAMTGGQPVDGEMTVSDIVRQLEAEGVRRIAIVAEDASPHQALSNPSHGITVDDRSRFSVVQNGLRDYDGVSVMIYDQTCAAEKRRRRKKGLMEDPPKRVFINEAVCEGCGDCSVKSNCLSVEPVETPFGRKRRINQSSCNKDYSCVNGFCPSFVMVEDAELRKGGAETATDELFDPAVIPHPMTKKLPSDRSYNILLGGIGGTGVTTISALIGMAAHLDGLQSTTMDQAGLAQKGGAVVSHVRLAPGDAQVFGSRVTKASADLVIAADIVVSASEPILARSRHDHTRAVLNTHLTPTAEFVENNKVQYDVDEMVQAIEQSCTKAESVDASGIAEWAFGDAIYGNLLLAGFAFQAGLIPVSATAFEDAIQLNGVAIETNMRAFRLGRALAHDRALSERIAASMGRNVVPAPDSLDAIIEHRRRHLTDYQNATYADRYLALVRQVRAREDQLGVTTYKLTEAVAKNYAKLLAYKDEYEVARLYTDGRFEKALNDQFTGKFKRRVYLAPPLLSPTDPETGQPKKIAFGGWMFQAFKILASLKGLRGSAFDVFGRTEERKMELQLIADYEADITRLLDGLTADKYAPAVAIAELPDQIRGYGHVKHDNIEKTRAAAKTLWQEFDSPAPAQHAA